MPCQDSMPGAYERGLVADDVRREYQIKIDRYARMLCSTCKEMEKEGLYWLLTEETKKWWEAHKEFDRKREAEEKKKIEEMKKKEVDLLRSLKRKYPDV